MYVLIIFAHCWLGECPCPCGSEGRSFAQSQLCLQSLASPKIPKIPVCALHSRPVLGSTASCAWLLPGVPIRGVETQLFLSAAQLGLFLWEGDKSQLCGPTSSAATHPEQLLWKGEEGSGVGVPGTAAIIKEAELGVKILFSTMTF